jgi:hypothetical protein
MTDRARNFPADSRSAAELYLLQGLAPIPLPPRTKDPGYVGWPRLRLTTESLDRQFPPQVAMNLGILNGLPSGNILDLDLDCQQALIAAPLLLPFTGWIFGRSSAPSSHRIYRTDVPLDTAQVAFKDIDGDMLIEMRGTGGQTVYPPSTHKETGELIQWVEFTDPGEVTLADLQRCAGVVAAAALVARHWPAGTKPHSR